MTTLPTVRDTAPDPSANEFEVGYIAEDGTRHRVRKRKPAVLGRLYGSRCLS